MSDLLQKAVGKIVKSIRIRRERLDARDCVEIKFEDLTYLCVSFTHRMTEGHVILSEVGKDSQIEEIAD